MNQYAIVEERLSFAETGDYVSFGIGSFDTHGHRIAYIADVSTNAQWVQALAARCNALHLDPVHLYDVVVDALSQ